MTRRSERERELFIFFSYVFKFLPSHATETPIARRELPIIDSRNKHMRTSSIFSVATSLLLLLALALPSAAASSKSLGINAVDIMWISMGQSPYGKDALEPAIDHITAACTRNLTSHVRFAATPYAASGFRSFYLADKQRYWNSTATLFRRIVSACPTVQLIPSLFWNWWAIPTLMKEPLGYAMTIESSQSRRFWSTYIQEFVAHIIDSGALPLQNIAAVELGNELNLLVDLNLTAGPGGANGVVSSQNNFTTTNMMLFQEWMASVITHAGSYKGPISTGHAVPRPSADHLRRSYYAPQRDWTPDSQSEFESILQSYCSCCTWCSVHYYATDAPSRPWTAADPNRILLSAAATTIASQGKQFYLGEFGDANPGSRPFSTSVLATLSDIAAAGIAPVVSTIWIWMFFQFSTTTAASYSILPGRDDAFIAEMQAFNS